MQGVLKGFDQRVNLILDKSVERVFSSEQGVQFEPLGLYIIRGDAVVTVGEIDEVSLKWKKKRCEERRKMREGRRKNLQ